MLTVYIAGPYSAATPDLVRENVRAARVIAERVAKAGAMPVTPHFLSEGIEDAMSEEDWYEGTMEVLAMCEVCWAMPGWERSKGARAEVEYAREAGIHVVSHVIDLKELIDAA